MARIVLCYKVDVVGKTPIETYARSFHRAMTQMGHQVQAIGQGHPIAHFSDMNLREYDLFIDLDTGRNGKDELHFQNFEGGVNIPSAVWFIDTHGHPSFHHRAAKHYDNVFFAVWRKRDAFAFHSSSHWCPNATDSRYFDAANHADASIHKKFDIGFFGSKGGLDRADILKLVCDRRNLFYDIREIGRQSKHRWPRTAEAMQDCRILFNKGQKHDGPNQRVFESMMMKVPLITDRDPEDGMSKLFTEGEHYLGYKIESDLGNQIDWLRSAENYDCTRSMVEAAYELVKEKHQVKNRVEQILEVCL
jgi:hypothetical protein